MAINVVGLVALLVFYTLILFVGIGAAWWKTRRSSAKGTDTIIVAGRNIGLFVGIFTMTATWVGGGYINGTAEAVFTSGLLHALAPIGYACSLCIGGLFFAKTMREREYLTMLDPLQEAYGSRVGGILFLPALMGELFWSASILNALGSSVAVIMDLDFNVSVIASAIIAVTYTFFGGLYSVAYTDVIQLICIALGLVRGREVREVGSEVVEGLCLPFAWTSPSVCWGAYSGNVSSVACAAVLNASRNNSDIFNDDWLGSVPLSQTGQYIDLFLLLVFGGMPWQVYFQRVLSTESAWMSQVLSFSGALGCIVMSIPSIIVGVIARHTDWGTDFQRIVDNPQIVLPLMATEAEVVWVIRGAIVCCGALATLIGLSIPSVYALFTLCSDFVYVLLFPQLALVIYVPWVNSYGVLSGFIGGLILRLLGGDGTLGIPATIDFGTEFPFKTASMALNLGLTLAVSLVARRCCSRRIDLRRPRKRVAASDHEKRELHKF